MPVRCDENSGKGQFTPKVTITTDGVKSHLTPLFAKLGVANRTEAVALALRERLLQEE